MTDYTNYEDFMTHSTKVGGLDEIHSHILQLTTEVKEQNKVIKSQVVKYKKVDDELTQAHVDWKEEGERRLFENIKLKKENEELKNKFEVIEQSTEHTTYMELEIERLQGDEYKQEILRDNIDDAMGNWVDDVFGVSCLDEVKEEMDKMKKENNELKFGVYIIQEALEKRVKEIDEVKEVMDKMKKENEKLKETLTKVDSLVSPVLFG
tara:strand:+ start:758 stop:1381 length:624 start_codon:yes stop_codon:yes gene_type:complete